MHNIWHVGLNTTDYDYRLYEALERRQRKFSGGEGNVPHLTFTSFNAHNVHITTLTVLLLS